MEIKCLVSEDDRASLHGWLETHFRVSFHSSARELEDDMADTRPPMAIICSASLFEDFNGTHLAAKLLARGFQNTVVICGSKRPEGFYRSLIDSGLVCACFDRPLDRDKVLGRFNQLAAAHVIRKSRSIGNYLDFWNRVREKGKVSAVLRELLSRTSLRGSDCSIMVYSTTDNVVLHKNSSPRINEFKVGQNLLHDRDLPFRPLLLEGKKLNIKRYETRQPGEMIEGFPFIGSLIAQPIDDNGKCRGMICLLSSVGRKFSQVETEYLDNLCVLASSLFSQISSLDELDQAKNELSRVYEDLSLTYQDLQSHVVIVDQLQSLNRKIHSATDIDFIVRELVAHAYHLLNCDFCLLAYREDSTGRFRIHTNNEMFMAQLRGEENTFLRHEPFDRLSGSDDSVLENDPTEELRSFFARYSVELKNLVVCPLAQKSRTLGFLAGFNKQDRQGFTSTDRFLVKVFTASAVTALLNNELIKDLRDLYRESVKALANAIEARDNYTRGHTDRVTAYSVAIARTLGWEKEKLEQVQIGTLLHDIGKIGIPDAILNKPSRLERAEYELMKSHVEIGARIILDIPQLRPVNNYILCHHERYDGGGYPAGLAGDDIPIAGRIVAVADSFDAMTSKRVYKEAMSVREAIEELRRCSGSQFDPGIVDTFIKLLEKGAFDRELSELRMEKLACAG